MSALPPKADIAERDWDVRFVLRRQSASQQNGLCSITSATINGASLRVSQFAPLNSNGSLAPKLRQTAEGRREPSSNQKSTTENRFGLPQKFYVHVAAQFAGIYETQ
jgi:hypothetical protein